MAERTLPAPVTREQEYQAAILGELVEVRQLLEGIVSPAGRSVESDPAGPPTRKKRGA